MKRILFLHSIIPFFLLSLFVITSLILPKKVHAQFDCSLCSSQCNSTQQCVPSSVDQTKCTCTNINNPNPVNSVFGQIKPPPGANRFGTGNFQDGLIPFINIILRLVFLVAGLWAFFNILFAGFMFMQAGGDPKAIGNAWGKIWQSFVGLLILTSSFLIAAIIGIVMFGSPTALLNPVLTGAP